MNESKDNPLIGENDPNNILFRSICCSISYFFCLLLIIIYIVLCLQVKCNVCTKKKNKDSNDLLDNDSEENKEKNRKEKGKIGLGSNFMFFLTVSNFFGSFFESLFYFFYENKINNLDGEDDEKKYDAFNNDSMCTWFGFAHNFFDLFSVCWISMLTLLFYKSTNLSSEMLYKDTKYLIIGFIFSTSLCVIFCGIPIFTNSYGFARFYCSFKYKEFRDGKKESVRLIDTFWRYSFIAIGFINNIFNIICLFITSRFYSKKLRITKKQNRHEYKVMLIFVWVFRVFPIVLLISRIVKGISRMIIESKCGDNIKKYSEYVNSFLFASNGIIDSIACVFFFRGVLWCCFSDSSSIDLSEEDEKKDSKMEDIGNFDD